MARVFVGNGCVVWRLAWLNGSLTPRADRVVNAVVKVTGLLVFCTDGQNVPFSLVSWTHEQNVPFSLVLCTDHGQGVPFILASYIDGQNVSLF